MSKKWEGICSAQKLTKKKEKYMREGIRFNKIYTAHQVAGLFDALDNIRSEARQLKELLAFIQK